MHQKKISFNNIEYLIPDKFNYEQFSRQICSCFIHYDIYVVKNCASISVDMFRSFCNYIFNQKDLPTINSDNVVGFRLLFEEFGVDFHSISGLNDDDLFKVNVLRFMTGIGDKSDIIQYIAKNLDYYIQNFPSDLINVPITILKNIFEHEQRKVDQKSAYELISKCTDISKYVLLECLDATELSLDQVEDSIRNLNECFGYAPQNTQTMITNIFPYYKQKLLEKEAIIKCDEIKKNKMNQVSLPEYLIKVPNGFFEFNEILTEVTIPDTVESIGSRAFYGCLALVNILIPNSVHILGDFAFFECKSLREINIPESLQIIGDHEFD